MRAESKARAARARVLCTVLLAAAGCADADDVRPDAGLAQATADGGGGTNPSEGGRNDGLDGGGFQVSTPPGTCNQLEIAFASGVPTVFLLVDRSSSMFDQGFWEPLKAGIMTVVERLASEVRFGFTSYTGQQGGICPQLTTLGAIAEDNYAAVRAAYDALGAPEYKGETPTALAIEQVAALLEADAFEGPKYILLVTDGEPDFCDDGNVTCARDAVVAAVQSAQARGIGSFIFSIGGQVDRGHLQDVANAGTGQPVEDRQNAVQQQCASPRATYSSGQGNAAYFEPNVNDQGVLVSALSSVIAGVRSCVFELQGRLRIDLGAADEGVIAIDGVRVPFGAPDGFRMNSATQLELLGASCERLRSPETKRVSIEFPCEAVLVI